MNRLLFILFLLLMPGFLAAQQATDKPRRGEGISTFLERNGRPGRAYYNEFLELNKKRLKGKKELMYGVSYVLPPKHGKASAKERQGNGRTLHEPLFGKKLDDVKVTGSRLEGACFYVVSGHGGPDKINALYAKDRKKYKYCRSIFLHVDSRGKRAQVDVFFYHADGSKYGRRLARTVRDVFEQKYHQHQPGRGFEGSVSARNLYVLNKSTPVALFVELGNIQNTFDQRRFVIADNRQALANWLMEGLVKDYRSK